LIVVSVLYALVSILLAIYGFNAFVMVFLYLRHRRGKISTPPESEFPRVTVQLPIYNELYVVDRLIDAAAAMDYRADKLEIQVLDDSTDETSRLAQARVSYHRARGVDIRVLHRDARVGFKAGALRQGLEEAKGELIAIFDADFVPEPDFLRMTVPHFLESSRLGFLQTRWGHINADYSPLTRAQAIALDGHFAVEQLVRHRAGLFMGFNGTGGIWRRQCIEDAGGWQDDTMCEDLDLSYRAQLADWEPLFLPDVVSPAEIPPQINAFKRQQSRWAKGSIQCARKLWRSVATAQVPLFRRAQGLIHLTSYMVHPLMLALLLTLVVLIAGDGSFFFPLAYFSLVSLGQPLLYVLAQRRLHGDWPRRYAYMPLLMLLGTGVALSNSCAIYEAVTGGDNQFRRTPKFHIETQEDQWARNRYALSSMDWITLGEFLVLLFAIVGVVISLRAGNLHAVPFLMLYVAGFAYVWGTTLVHSLADLRIRLTDTMPELRHRVSKLNSIAWLRHDRL
jgi:cellulose synthase/poly-beta-1,6-N-acetylglucosamine synthase-like glycosyltransferase